MIRSEISPLIKNSNHEDEMMIYTNTFQSLNNKLKKLKEYKLKNDENSYVVNSFIDNLLMLEKSHITTIVKQFSLKSNLVEFKKQQKLQDKNTTYNSTSASEEENDNNVDYKKTMDNIYETENQLNFIKEQINDLITEFNYNIINDEE